MQNQDNEKLRSKIERIINRTIDERGVDAGVVGRTTIVSMKEKAVEELITLYTEEIAKGKEVTGETSDGYHTFNELYEFRKLYNAGFFNELMYPWKLRMFRQYNPYNVHKSKKHSDCEDCFGGGWFVVMATLPTGQISNHYELKDWDLFQVEERERADVWDGHTAQDVAKRLKDFLSQPTTKLEEEE